MLFCFWHLAANATDVIPSYLTGSWGTAASLYEGDKGQSEMYLFSDGSGLMVGSSPPAKRTDGVEDGMPGPRALAGFPIRVTLENDVLLARPFSPRESENKELAGMVISCHYDAPGAILTCKVPAYETIKLTRRSETVPREIGQMLGTLW